MTPSHRVGALCGHGPGHPREKDTYDVQRSDAAAVTGTRAHSGDARKLTVCTGTQNDQMAGTSYDFGGFQLLALERLVKEDFGGIDQSRERVVSGHDQLRASPH